MTKKVKNFESYQPTRPALVRSKFLPNPHAGRKVLVNSQHRKHPIQQPHRGKILVAMGKAQIYAFPCSYLLAPQPVVNSNQRPLHGLGISEYMNRGLKAVEGIALYEGKLKFEYRISNTQYPPASCRNNEVLESHSWRHERRR